MVEEELKVNDKRMFTADGELREEYKHLDEVEPESRERPERPTPQPEEVVAEPAADREQPSRDPAPEPAGSRGAPSPAPGEPGPAPGELSILDLVGLLAEHTALYLGEAELPDGQSVRDLGAAKLHLDLLDVLRRKTAGNLTEEEAKVLEDILYRLRMIYVEKVRQEG